MTPKVESIADLISLLELALSSRKERVSAIKAFQDYVWNRDMPVLGATGEQDETLNELAHDLDFYEPNPDWRIEDYSFYGDQRLEIEIVEALRKLRESATASGHEAAEEQ